MVAVKLRETVAELSTTSRGSTPQTDLLEGPAADAILRAAEAQHADLIVMGSRGLGGIQALLGSVSSQVMRQAACPVVIAHRPPPVEHPEQESAKTVGV